MPALKLLDAKELIDLGVPKIFAVQQRVFTKPDGEPGIVSRRAFDSVDGAVAHLKQRAALTELADGAVDSIFVLEIPDKVRAAYGEGMELPSNRSSVQILLCFWVNTDARIIRT